MSEDITDQIQEAAAEPRRASVDGQSVEGRGIDELIQADKHLQSKQAAKRGFGVTIQKIQPGGTV